MESSPKDTPSIFLNRKLRRKLAREFIRRFCSGFSGGILLFAGVRIVTALLRNPFRERYVCGQPPFKVFVSYTNNFFKFYSTV